MSQKSAPLISIIVATFNCEATLQQCINSIKQQTYQNKELIIIDGSSIDGTVNLLEANRDQISYWNSEPDRGIYNAWNKGLARARGEWICFLGADDYFWDAQVLERMSEQLGKIPSSIRVAYGQVMIVNKHGESLYLLGENWQKVKKHFNKVMCIPHVGTMHRRSLFELHGKFDESFRIVGDYELLLRELKTNDAYFIQDVIVAAMRQDGISNEIANTLLIIRETKYAAEMHGQRLSRLYLLMAKAYIKLLLRGLLGKRLVMKLINIYRRIKMNPPFGIKPSD
jgi:glycosyltransferase involved in cell wall biosynthesis